jgi:hypothetical protein
MLSLGLAVAFEPYAPDRFEDLRGVISLAENPELLRMAAELGLSCYQVYLSAASSASDESPVKFTESELIHRAFRNRELPDPSVRQFSSVPQASEILAEIANTPVWSVERSSHGETYYVGLPLPPFDEGDFFHQHFRAAQWFALVPLLHFLRRLVGDDGWPRPEPRATFIIDDPNLHHRTYGYIDFERLAAHAAAHNYHATIATVPLDTWYVNQEVADIFRSQHRYISMMMHGVNHIADELARNYSYEEALALLASGLRRIAALEARSGVQVDRVMAAPHGAFAEAVADPMVRLGYEAGCVSIGSLARWNPDKKWRADLGFPMAQVFGNLGLPVFHRTGANEVDIRLSAFLGHPVVIATHHHDYISNFARIESLAKIVNDISAPRWMPIADISRSNYLASSNNGILCIQPFARKLAIPISPEVTSVQLNASAFGPDTTLDLQQPATQQLPIADLAVQYALSNGTLHITIPAREHLDYRQVPPGSLGLWPIARRMLAEGRDRVKPMLSFAGS